MKTRQQMNDLGYAPDPSAAVLYFLTAKLNDKEAHDIRKQIPRRDLAEAWRDIEDHAKELAKRLTGKEASTPSRTWKLLSSARQEMVLFLAVTARQKAVAEKIKNFFTKWRQVQQKLPLPEMTELLITPQLPAVSQDCRRRLHADAGRPPALPHRADEIPEAAGSSTTATAATAAPWTRRESRHCTRRTCPARRKGKESRQRCARAGRPGNRRQGRRASQRSAETGPQTGRLCQARTHKAR